MLTKVHSYSNNDLGCLRRRPIFWGVLKNERNLRRLENAMILHGIAIKSAKRGPMQLTKTGIITHTGLESSEVETSHHTAQSHRQVTILSLEQWQSTMKELNSDIPWYMRRANLCVSGHNFGPGDVGKTIFIGANVALEITRETDPCKRMDEILPGLHAALVPSWRGGICCRVISIGTVCIGDRVVLRS